MLITPSGRSIFVIDRHPRKAYSPIVLILLGSTTSFSLKQYENIAFGIAVVPSGIVIRSRLLAYSKVFSDDMNRGHIVYYGANSTAIQSALGTAVQGVMLQGVTPEAAYNQLKKTVQELIEE